MIMTKLEELVDWLEKQVKDPWGVVPALVAYGNCLAKARQLLAEEKAEEQKATADEGQVMDLFEKWLRDGVACGAVDTRVLVAYIDYLKSRPVKEEPLACLADRKGMRISKIENCHYPVGWLIHLTPKCITGNEPLWQRYDKTIEIPQGDNVDTYPAAESAARKYLLALPDKGEAR